MMAAVPGDTLDPIVERLHRAPIKRHAPCAPAIARIERYAFYERATEAFAIVIAGELSRYGTLLPPSAVMFSRREKVA
jgi:L-fucose mutarotase